MTSTAFSSLPLPQGLIDNLETLGYTQMTPIQAQSLPLLLEGKDVVAQAKTGSGKTAAFGLGLLANLNVKRFRVQSLVLCPTRELADQVAIEIRRLARGIHNIKVLTLCGGVSLGPQIGSLEHGAHIIVGTPGRIDDHLSKGRLCLDELNTLVLDEADRMLEMGFQSALDAIFEKAPAKRQTLLFSATFPSQIQTIAKRVMQDPEMVTIAATHDNATIEQHFHKVDGKEGRYLALCQLISYHQPESSVVFCNTKRETQAVADQLHMDGFSVLALHGDLEQRDRDQTLLQFANKSVSILVATDVAARGLDIDALDAVFNYEISRDPEVHVHRVGRTGRAGSQGIACTLFGEHESYQVALIEDYIDRVIEAEPLPLSANPSLEPMQPKMVTLQIDGGKKQKIRPGDILGALTGDKTISGDFVGKIHRTDLRSYVAVHRSVAKKALKKLSEGKLKGRNFRVRILP